MSESEQAKTVPADVLKRALDAVKPACSRQYPPGAEDCLRIGEGIVECVSAEIRLTMRVPELAALPRVVVSMPRLHSIAREAVGLVTLAVASGKLAVEVRSTGGLWALQTPSPALWPGSSGDAGAPVCRLPGDQFARCVSCVLPAASGDAGRWAGVKVETRDGDESKGEDAEDKVVHFTATDGRRLYTTRASFEQAVNDASFLVPAAAMRIVATAAARSDEPVQVCVSSSTATFTIGALTVRARLLDAATFPQWRKVVPARKPRPTVVGAAAMLAAVRQAAIVTSEQSRAVVFSFGDKQVKLNGKSADYGESACAVEPVSVGVAASVHLDPRFIGDFLSHVVSLDSGATVGFDVANSQAAVVLSHDDAMAVVMPISGDCE